MSALEACGLGYAVDGRSLVTDASFALRSGTLTMLIGPNGAGKTTLLRLALGLLKPATGRALIDGQDTAAMPPVERARKVAYLPQLRPLVWPQPVGDIVALGRFAYGAVPGALSPQDKTAIGRAISLCALEGFEERAADTLSGGESSRMHVARALAAQTPLLVADEPVAALDPRYQHQVLRIFADVARADRCLLIVVHDLSLAARYADRLLWMKDGAIVADGSPGETMTPERLEAVFGIEAQVAIGSNGEVLLRILGPA
ncbi:MAG: ABC transporter ATP-binding protein [Erythrobacter sp.]|jgi:iron complex transport system ATP-binding protein|nr:ABC transporter ATP-binding protein [Erythrobacter sp.]